MISLENQIEKRFFDSLINQDSSFNKTPIGVYQKLVYMRYEEVINNSFPLFIKEISQDELKASILEFMKNTPTTAFVWQVPKDYMEFVKNCRYFLENEYLYELLYYDWIEIELTMKEYKEKRVNRFSYNKNYKLSSSAKVKYFQYDLINKNYDLKRDNYLVIYFDFEIKEVVYREINPVIFFLLENIFKKKSIGEYLENLCIENEIDFDEAKELLEEPLKELLSLRVFS